jgi:endonuclease III
MDKTIGDRLKKYKGVEEMNANTPITTLKGVGEKTAKLF